MAKNILIINGHPNKESLNYALAEAYKKGAIASGAMVTQINIGELNFNPNLQYGYQKRMELEPDLLHSIELIKQADHLVWIHPLWWAGFPAIMKGFIDRIFLPGITFERSENSIFWKKLLKGKTARIITTIDQPAWYYRFISHQPGVNQLKNGILKFCGVNPVKVSYFGIIKNSKEAKRIKWLNEVETMGLNQK